MLKLKPWTLPEYLMLVRAYLLVRSLSARFRVGEGREGRWAVDGACAVARAGGETHPMED